MSSATPFFRATTIGLTALGLLLVLPLGEAQVPSVPKVVADAQIDFALTTSGSPVTLSNPSGVATAPDGTIYVADSANSRIVRISTQGALNESPTTNPGKIGATATFLIPSDGLSDPNAVAVGPDGTLYFSDAVRKTLYRVANPASESPVYARLDYSQAQAPSALAVDPSGDLWVADAGLKEIVEFAPGATSPTRKASVSPMAPTGIAVSASSLYFSDAATNAVYGQGMQTPLLSGFAGTKFDFAADLAAARPTGLALDGAGNLFILDASGKRLVELNPNEPSTAFLVPSSGLGSPASLAVGPTGNLYITTRQDLTEFVYNGNAVNFGDVVAGKNSSTVTLNYSFNVRATTTRFYQKMLGEKTSKFSFSGNGCIAAEIKPGYTCRQEVHVNYGPTTSGLQKGMVALANDKDDVLGAINSFGQSQAAVVAFYPGTLSYLSQSSPNAVLLEPQAVVATGTGSDLFIADEGSQQSGTTYTYSGVVWDYPQPSGTPTKIGGSTFQSPSALALDAAGDLYVADYNLGAVYISSATRRSNVTKLTIPGGVTLNHPIALAFDPSGNLYIGDTGPAGAGATAADPGFVVKVPTGGGSATKLSYSISGAPVIFPQALATDTAGNLYIADAGDGQTTMGDLVVVPARTGVARYISTGSYTLSEPAGLGFDPALNLYVLDGYNQRVLTIPVTLAATTGVPSFGAASLLPQNFPIATGSSMFVWPSGQQITLTDIGEPPSGVSQVVTLNTQTANIQFGPIPVGSSQNGTVTALNVGNVNANFTPTYTRTGDTGAFSATKPVCSGGIAPQGQCNIAFTYQPDQLGTTTARFSFYVNSVATPSNYVNASGQSAKATATVTLQVSSNSLTYDAGENVIAIISGTFGTPTGTVKIFDGTTLLTTVPVTVQGNGEAYFYVPNGDLQAGTNSLTAVYSGDGEYTTATSPAVIVNVAPAPTSLSGAYCYSSNGGTPGGNIVCGVSISSQTSVQPTGNVVFTVNGVPRTVPLVNQSALLTLTNAGRGTYTIGFSYAAQGNYAASTASSKTVVIN